MYILYVDRYHILYVDKLTQNTVQNKEYFIYESVLIVIARVSLLNYCTLSVDLHITLLTVIRFFNTFASSLGGFVCRLRGEIILNYFNIRLQQNKNCENSVRGLNSWMLGCVAGSIDNNQTNLIFCFFNREGRNTFWNGTLAVYGMYGNLLYSLPPFCFQCCLFVCKQDYAKTTSMSFMKGLSWVKEVPMTF